MSTSVIKRRLPKTILLACVVALLAIAAGPTEAHAQNKMRKLNSREKEALSDFQKKKDDKDKANKSDKKKKSLFSFLSFKSKKSKKEDAGLKRSMNLQEKAVKKRMRKNKRKAKNW